MKKYWYFITYSACPVCGHDYSYRERRYTTKPEDAKERYGYDQPYDNCMGY